MPLVRWNAFPDLVAETMHGYWNWGRQSDPQKQLRLPVRRRKKRARVPEQKSLNMHWTSVRTVGIPLWALRATPPPALRVAGLFLFDWHTHHIPPLGPGSVVVPNLFEP